MLLLLVKLNPGTKEKPKMPEHNTTTKHSLLCMCTFCCVHDFVVGSKFLSAHTRSRGQCCLPRGHRWAISTVNIHCFKWIFVHCCALCLIFRVCAQHEPRTTAKYERRNCSDRQPNRWRAANMRASMVNLYYCCCMLPTILFAYKLYSVHWNGSVAAAVAAAFDGWHGDW